MKKPRSRSTKNKINKFSHVYTQRKFFVAFWEQFEFSDSFRIWSVIFFIPLVVLQGYPAQCTLKGFSQTKYQNTSILSGLNFRETFARISRMWHTFSRMSRIDNFSRISKQVICADFILNEFRGTLISRISRMMIFLRISRDFNFANFAIFCSFVKFKSRENLKPQ